MDIKFTFWFIISPAPKKAGQFVKGYMYTSKTGRVSLQGTIIKPPRISDILYFAQDAQVAHWMCQCEYMRDICTRLYFFPNAQYMHKICARLYLFLQCTRFAQDCVSFLNAHYMRKIVLISPMRNICPTFAQDCTSFPNAQYMRKIGLYLFPQCEIYAQDLCKIVLISPMRKICARLYLFLQCAIYVHDLHKIVLISPMCNICTRLQALLEEICHISHICSKFRMVFTS